MSMNSAKIKKKKKKVHLIATIIIEYASGPKYSKILNMAKF